MTTMSDLPMSSLLEKANYIKKAMGNIEKEITNQTFIVQSNGIEVHIKGTCTLEKIIVDSTTGKQPTQQLLPKIVDAVNKSINEINNRRQQEFKIISQNIQDSES